MALKLGNNSETKSNVEFQKETIKKYEEIINKNNKYSLSDVQNWVKRKYSILKKVESGAGCVGNYFQTEKEIDDFLCNHMPDVVDFDKLEQKDQEEWIRKTEEFINISKLYLIGNKTDNEKSPFEQVVMIEGTEYQI